MISDDDFRVGDTGRALADWNSMPAVGRERWWLPSANRYPLKTLIELRKIAVGPARPPPKGTKEAKLANMRRFLRRSNQELYRAPDLA